MPLSYKVLIQDMIMLFIITSSVIFENKCYVTDLLLFILLFLHAIYQHFCSLSALFIPVVMITSSVCGCTLLLTKPSGFLLLTEH